VAISFLILGKFSTTISTSIFSRSFFLSSSSGTLMIRMLGCLILSQRSLSLSSFLSIIFFFFPFCFIYFYHCIFYLNYPIIYLLYSTACSLQSVFLSHLLHHSLLIDSFFISSRSLLHVSCIFSILVSRLVIFNSILFSRFWIVFVIIILNSLSGRFRISSSFVLLGGHLSVPLPAEYFSAFSSCLYCCVWGGLSVFWQFVVLLYCGGSSLWVGLDGWLFKFSGLGKLVSVFWWVELDFFSLECNEVSSS